MSAKNKNYRVKVGESVFTIYPHLSGWQVAVYDEDGKRKYITRASKAAIEEAVMGWVDARAWAVLSPARKRFLAEMSRWVPEGEENAVLGLLQGRKASASMESAAARYRAHLEGRGRTGRHIRATLAEVEALAAVHPGNVGDVTLRDLERFMTDRCGGGAHRRMAIRRALTGFFRYCRSVRLVPNEEMTVADMLPSVIIPAGNRRILTVAEFNAVKKALPAKHLTWAMIGALAGLRPEEIAPSREKRRDGKRGLTWENIDFEFGHIRLSAEASKVNRARIVPMCESLAAYLRPLAGVGIICPTSPAEDRSLRRVGEVVFGDSGWPQDCLRHSYGSYRNSILRDMGRVAEEMGTSIDMLHKHYHDPVAKELGEEWFEVQNECKTKKKNA